MEVVPKRALLKVDIYIVVEFLDNVVVRACASDPKYQYCYCNPNMGLMGNKDLMVIFGYNIHNSVLVMANIRATEVLKNSYFAL